LQLQHETLGKVGKVMAIPANILVDISGNVRWLHYASVVMDRPSPQKVLSQALCLGTNEKLLAKK
jgi:hypothetical protein